MGSVTSNPKVNIQLLPAAIVDAFEDRKDLICGQNGTVSTAITGALNTGVEAMTTDAIKALFGTTSFLTNMILEWKATNNSKSPLDVIGLEPAAAGTAAIGVVTLTGAATADGTLEIDFVDEKKYKVIVDVDGDTPDSLTEIADKITAAYAALTNDPVFTVGNVAGVITATAVDTGAIGGNYGIKIINKVPGLVATITTKFTPSNPAIPTVTGIFDVIDGIRYTGIIWPEDWFIVASIVTTELETRFNADNAIMDGTAFSGMTETYSQILTNLLSLNSQTLVTMGSPLLVKASTPQHDGPAVLRPADWVCCEFLGIRSRRMTPGASIADAIITTSGALDNTGGPSLASLPYFNTPLRNTPVTSSAYLFSAEDQADLEEKGYACIGVNDAQNGMVTAPVVTNWTTDAGGNDNVSYHYLNYVDTGSACREIFYNVLKSTFAQSRLTEGDLIPQRSMANAESIKAELLRIYKFLSGIALTQEGATAEKFFSDNTTVTVSLATRTTTIAGPLPIVTQLGTINYSLQLAFTITGTATQITV